MICKATLSDIPSVLNLTKACAAAMRAQGIFQWNATYPNQDVFIQDVEREELFVLKVNARIVGCIVSSKRMDDEYKAMKWLTTDRHNLYIHRLAVHPEFQGLGYAQQLMCFVEQQAVTHKYQSIRLDTFSKNKRNQKFYELRGYKKLGDIHFPNQSDYPFHCYELVL